VVKPIHGRVDMLTINNPGISGSFAICRLREPCRCDEGQSRARYLGGGSGSEACSEFLFTVPERNHALVGYGRRLNLDRFQRLVTVIL
jgi:hypothetical protein